jgi:hypothetical protein
MRPWSRGSSLALGIGFAVAIAIAWKQPAPPRAVEGPGEFSASHAMENLRWIAREPHPVGTAAHAEVARRLEETFRQLGFVVEIQAGQHIDRRMPTRTRLVQVRNVLAKLPGTASTGSVVLMAHYDSVSVAPGAADDGASVAMLLETARLLKAEPPLRNDVIFVITDAEETGLNGARVFLAEHPWAQGIGAILNFEARGVSGPSMLFETGERDGWLIRQFATVVPTPFGSSLAPALYERMPNSTDLTVFRGSGVARLNFAFAEGWQAYHSAGDNVANIDMQSLRHHGSSALALARRLGSLDLPRAKADGSRLVYFNLGPSIVRYDDRLAMLIALAAFASCGAFVIWRRRTDGLRVRDVLVGLGAVLLAVVVAFGATRAVWWAVVASSVDRRALWQQSGLYMPAFVILATIVLLVLYRVMRRLGSSDGLVSGAMIWFVILGVAVAAVLPGASFVFSWPLMAGVIAAWGCRDAVDDERFAVRHLLAIAGGTLVVLLILVPTLRVAYLAMPTQAVWFVPLLALAFMLLSPGIELFTNRLSRLVLIGGVGLAAAMLTAAVVRANRAGSSSQPAAAIYVEARESSSPASWSWYDGRQPRGANERFEVPAAALAGPQLIVDDDVRDGETRTLSLRLVPRREASEAGACVRSTQGILRASSHGQPFDVGAQSAQPHQVLTGANATQSSDRCDLIITSLGAAPQGVPITLDVPALASIDVEVLDRSADLTSSADLARVLQRPDATPVASVTVSRRFSWAPVSGSR